MIIHSRSKAQLPSLTVEDKAKFLNRKREVDTRLKARQVKIEAELQEKAINHKESRDV